MIKFFAVFLGGGLGSLVRFGIAEAVSPLKSGFPAATFLANVISCCILGFLLALVSKSEISPFIKFLFVTGFCGGFSTFSTFTGETFQLFQNGNWTTALIYVFSSFLVCLFSLYLGFKIANLTG